MNLIDKINDKSAKIGVIGLGYVGLPLALEFTNASYKVIGIDINDKKVKKINLGNNYIKDVKDSSLKKAVKHNLLSATTDFSKVQDLDAISICSAYSIKQGKES